MKFRRNDNPDVLHGKCQNEHNYLGHEIIEIVQFNYDGQGGALCMFDNENEIDSLSIADIEFVLFDVHYSLELPAVRNVLFECIRR